MRYMSEQTAWRLLAVIFAGRVEWNSILANVRFANATWGGLCQAIGEIRNMKLISGRTASKMRGRYARRRARDGAYKWARDAAGMNDRAVFCRRQAQIR